MNNLFFQRAYHIIFIRHRKSFWGKPFVNERSRNPRVSVAKRRHTLLYEVQFLSRYPRFSRNKFFFFPYLHSERKKGGLFYNDIPSLTHFSDSRESRYRIQIVLNDWENGGRWLCKKKIGTRMIVYLFLITPDRIYTYIRKIPVCVHCLLLYYFSFLAFS